MNATRRVRTEPIRPVKTYRNAIRNGIRGVAAFPTGWLEVQFLGRNSPKVQVHGMTGETRWFGQFA